MKFDINYLLKEKKEVVSVILLGLSILLVVLMLLKITSFIEASARAQDVVRTALDQGITLPAAVEEYLKPDREIVNALTQNNIFGAVPESPTNPVREVRGIIGDSALINDNEDLYKVGDMFGGSARIVAIEPTQVVIEWNGRQYDYEPIDASVPQNQQGQRGSARGTQVQSNVSMVTVSSTVGGQTVERVSSSVPGLQNMTQAERERLRNQMSQQFGGRGGMGGRGGGMGGRGGFGGGRGGRGGRGG